jgi:hypothetical protein
VDNKFQKRKLPRLRLLHRLRWIKRLRRSLSFPRLLTEEDRQVPLAGDAKANPNSFSLQACFRQGAMHFHSTYLDPAPYRDYGCR